MQGALGLTPSLQLRRRKSELEKKVEVSELYFLFRVLK